MDRDLSDRCDNPFTDFSFRRHHLVFVSDLKKNEKQTVRNNTGNGLGAIPYFYFLKYRRPFIYNKDNAQRTGSVLKANLARKNARDCSRRSLKEALILTAASLGSPAFYPFSHDRFEPVFNMRKPKRQKLKKALDSGL